MELNYKSDMRIDESALDIEWLEQSSLAIKYGMHWAECKAAVDRLEEQLKVVRSELVNEAYANPDSVLGVGVKPTAQNVEAYFRTSKKHKRIKDELIEAQKELSFAEIAKNEIGYTRKTALENLVKLYIANYFSVPNVPRDIVFERRNRDASRKENNARVRVRSNQH